ncbi:hypothetical protein CYMTET_37661 [Cymbomonas tetramitiformis]|uniref:RRM domain-containing protein n=1 Tax=Cymbomonas tetramitiformis TaxID=36881 RepID=A0AAE0CF03_9CHLO|nr:hypothetical protein CYMTET_37661 [Cymbomonas tetramitiformis]
MGDIQEKLNMSLDDLVGGHSQENGRPGKNPRGQKRIREDDGPIRVGRRCYVGNLSFKTTWQDLKDHFRQAGQVVYADVMREGNSSNGRSRGCGIVEFETAEEAANAINTLNDVECDGRPLFVREDREDRDLREATGGGAGRSRPPAQNAAPSGARQPRERGGGGDHEGVATVGRRVYVMNLSWDTTWQSLKDHFRNCGNVIYADVMNESGSGRSKGCGIVEFEQASEALMAISTLSNSELDGRSILVREDREDRDLGGGSKGGGGRGAGRQQQRGSQQPQYQQTTVGTQLVVQNLPWSVTWQELKDLFRTAGTVARADVRTDESGRSKGYGTVTMNTPQEAAAAIQKLNNMEVDGRTIAVRVDKFAQQ